MSRTLKTDGDHSAADMSRDIDMRTADETTESLSYLMRGGAVHSVTSEQLPQQEVEAGRRKGSDVKARIVVQQTRRPTLEYFCAQEKLEAQEANYSLCSEVKWGEAIRPTWTKTLSLFSETPGIEEPIMPDATQEEPAPEEKQPTPGEAQLERVEPQPHEDGKTGLSEPVPVHEERAWCCEAPELISEAIVVW
jgi:hypothetical protein